MYRNCRNRTQCCPQNGIGTVTMNIYDQTPLLDYYELISLLNSSCQNCCCGCSCCDACSASCGCGCSQ